MEEFFVFFIVLPAVGIVSLTLMVALSFRDMRELKELDSILNPSIQTTPAPVALETSRCEWCEQSFLPAQPGQRFCGNACGSKSATCELPTTLNGRQLQSYSPAWSYREKERAYQLQWLAIHPWKQEWSLWSGGARARRRLSAQGVLRRPGRWIGMGRGKEDPHRGKLEQLTNVEAGTRRNMHEEGVKAQAEVYAQHIEREAALMGLPLAVVWTLGYY
jgi:hypothetical protein